jgi:hypothetical protein
MKKVGIALALLCVLIVAGTLLLKNVHAAEQSSLQTFEYATVRWAGRENTHLIRPNGQVEFLGPILTPAKRPDRADERVFYMTLAINAVAREGFEVAAMTDSEVLLRRSMPK